MPPLASSLEKLFAHEDWFEDPEREIGTGAVPPILVLDDFYEDPDEIRRAALARPYVQYIPPDPDIVGVETAEKNARRQGRWLAVSAHVTRA